MSQRPSGYARLKVYETPAWVTEALIPRLPEGIRAVWEPAAGSGAMRDVLARWDYHVAATDIETGTDFLAASLPAGRKWHAIISNPPYELATEFCEHALRLMEPERGAVAMLLRADFDSAQGRTHLFRDCPAFAQKLVLMRRIVWFVEADGKPKASPSYNHCWMIWDWMHEGPPTIGYAL